MNFTDAERAVLRNVLDRSDMADFAEHADWPHVAVVVDTDDGTTDLCCRGPYPSYADAWLASEAWCAELNEGYDEPLFLPGALTLHPPAE